MSDGTVYAVESACSCMLGTRRSIEPPSTMERWRPRYEKTYAFWWRFVVDSCRRSIPMHLEIERVFNALTRVLSSGRARAQVSAAKALHVVAPSFLPMWDSSISSKMYNCPYDEEPGMAYVAFCERIRLRVASLQVGWTR